MNQVVGLERSLLRALLDGGDEAVSLAVDAGLRREDFLVAEHGRFYEQTLLLWEKEAPINRTSLAAVLGRGNRMLASLDEATGVPPGKVTGHARLIRDQAMLRRLAVAARRIQRAVADRDADPAQVLDEAQRAVAEAADRGDDTAVHVGETLSMIIKARGSGGGDRVTRTGFAKLDELLGGLRPGRLYLVAGRTGAGKTSLLISLTANMAVREDAGVLFVSKEQTERELCGLLLGCQARASVRLWLSGRDKVDESDERLIQRAIFRLSKAPIHWFRCRGSGETALRSVRARARGLKARRGLDVLMIDYLQLFASRQAAEEISEISQGLKRLAMDLDIAVVAACQLNRAIDYRDEKDPVLADLKGSGSLEQDSDVVLFICPPDDDALEMRHDVRPEESYMPRMVEIVVGKNRGGPRGKLPLVFEPWCPRFSDARSDEFS